MGFSIYKSAITYSRPEGLPSAVRTLLLCSEWEEVFPRTYGHRHTCDGRVCSTLTVNSRSTERSDTGRILQRNPRRPDHQTFINAIKRSAISTGKLKTLLSLHTQPIHLVVYQGPAAQRASRPYLGEGFTLRCFQRLTFPGLATLRCR